jgi:tetrahydromethanopterin S-methyltransferase subunit F
MYQESKDIAVELETKDSITRMEEAYISSLEYRNLCRDKGLMIFRLFMILGCIIGLVFCIILF